MNSTCQLRNTCLSLAFLTTRICPCYVCFTLSCYSSKPTVTLYGGWITYKHNRKLQTPCQTTRRTKEEPHLNLDCNLTMASSIEGTLFLKDDHCVDVKLIPEFSPKAHKHAGNCININLTVKSTKMYKGNKWKEIIKWKRIRQGIQISSRTHSRNQKKCYELANATCI